MKRFFSTLVKYVEGQDIKPNICKNCKYIKPAYEHFLLNGHYEFARCKKLSKIDIINGKSYPEYASVVRLYDCKGKWFENKN